MIHQDHQDQGADKKTPLSNGVLHPLELKIAKQFSVLGLQKKSFLVGCSGGCDSVATAFLICALSQKFFLKTGLAYIYHGSQSNVLYRKKAFELVRKLAHHHRVPFYSNFEIHVNQKTWNQKIKINESEQSLREFRQNELAKIQKEENFEILVQGHQWGDLLETRLIRLIRGTGIDGMTSMEVLTKLNGTQIYRPFLETHRKTLEGYVLDKGTQGWKDGWLEDPTNKNEEPLRNWIRTKWLKDLEQKREGATENMARSLQLIVENLNFEKTDNWSRMVDKDAGKIDRLYFESLEGGDRRRLVAFYLKWMGVSGYTSGHVDEICKRLKTQQKTFRFFLAKREWIVDADFFYLCYN